MAMMLMGGLMLMMSKVVHAALKSLSFKSSKIMEKYWNLELTSAELSIIKIAVERYAEQYKGSVFTKDEFATTFKAINNPIHRML